VKFLTVIGNYSKGEFVSKLKALCHVDVRGAEVNNHAFLTSELDGVCGQLPAPVVLSSGKEHPVPI
jgi:hypothetical protein